MKSQFKMRLVFIEKSIEKILEKGYKAIRQVFRPSNL
jgi:hypothetical protein